MKGSHVYSAIVAVASAIAKVGVPKTHTNEQDGYQYRSIDDVLDRVAPLLAKHRLCILPCVLERSEGQRRGEGAGALTSVSLKVAFDLISARDGSGHRIEVWGEGVDESDKATAKAMSAAFKTAMVQAFCIPVTGVDETQTATLQPRLHRTSHDREPVQGWEQWCHDVIDLIGVCQSEDALRRVQDSNRSLLKAISRERTGLYTRIGDAFLRRSAELNLSPSASAASASRSKTSPKKGLRKDKTLEPVDA